MSLQPGDALVAHNFGIQIDGVMVEFLQEVSSLTMDQDVIEYKQVSANGQPMVKKLPGARKAGECTVVRGATQSAVFTQWIRESIEGNMGSARKNASIIFMDYERRPVKRYNLSNAWCSKVEVSSAKAGDTSALTETITITFEELTLG
ncbi:phage tail protein [Streptomyces clavuligerus]|uniref:Phage tail protein n=1 Tax=Streptomyces clavuligerus TaxID=1901 RepID=D5SL90_STRCL|nr:phage tail protein [Streptomyces clavuligerus]ANW22556.1 phage tail protein [Streptomyces clavuligerus]AXU16967.1 phage tail protein [Streptomyces clavuligerus]AXU17444.1 phage tail protein [Streptomyces clavuligerus]EFG04683.1 phage tail protein [Streptomyces clavuligerus]MBY6306868.1 phage tail protein [Streptomyces clavuligerus]